MKLRLDLTPGPCSDKQKVFIDNICEYYGLPIKERVNSEEAREFLNKWAKRFFADMSETYRYLFQWASYAEDVKKRDPRFFITTKE